MTTTATAPVAAAAATATTTTTTNTIIHANHGRIGCCLIISEPIAKPGVNMVDIPPDVQKIQQLIINHLSTEQGHRSYL